MTDDENIVIDDEDGLELVDDDKTTQVDQEELLSTGDGQQEDDQGDKGSGDDSDDDGDYGRKVQKRINKLVSEREIEKSERVKIADENEILRQRLEQIEKRIQQDDNDAAQSKIKQLQRKRVELLDEGEHEQAVHLEDELLELKIRQQRPPQAQQPAPQAPPVQPQSQQVNVPQKQQAWLDQNDWYFNPTKKSQAEQANSVYLSMLNEGYGADDAETYTELDRRISNKPVRQQQNRPPSPGAPGRGNVIGNKVGKTLTARDIEVMRNFGLDPKNGKHRSAFLKNRGS